MILLGRSFKRTFRFRGIWREEEEEEEEKEEEGRMAAMVMAPSQLGKAKKAEEKAKASAV